MLVRLGKEKQHLQVVLRTRTKYKEDYHMVTVATKPLRRQRSNNTTTTTQNEHLISEPLNTQQDPVNLIAIAIEKLARRKTQPSLFHPKTTLTFNGELEKNENIGFFEDLIHTTLRIPTPF